MVGELASHGATDTPNGVAGFEREVRAWLAELHPELVV
jgi:hypothetical protein